MTGLKKSDLILSDSISTKNDLVQKLQIDEKKIIVCHLGVKKVWFKDNPPHKTSFNIVHIGSMFYKNTETVIQVMIELKKVNNKYKLIKIGKLSPEQKEALAKNQVPYQELTGLSDEQVRTHYQNAAALLFPSIYEGFGLPILEAMACGCPVVCSNAGSLKELLYTGALSAEPYDVSTFTKHILSLENQATRKKHMVLGKKHAQKYYWEYCAKRLEKIYLKAIEYLK
jgi:glycosyltransferase involved in cell wall biosynthesis